ncbi:hypothetical protein [Ruminiclostridium cellobioparum]|uniref:hypothetical protein n=1 Tax=Ruminiclostridium cellobioparum TaxID=29355 RepID=UPI00048849C0|nr:hypothetical protein [Ruminiclostridium cellobioparum]
MDITTYYFCSRISKGEAEASEYVDWAIEQLVKGAETPSVKILSSFMKPLYKPELEEYFHKSLDELGWRFPPFTENARMCIKHLAEKILDGSLEPIKGAHEIYTYVRELKYPEDLIAWLEIDDYIDERVYNGIYQMNDEELIERIIGEAYRLI